jgi:methionine-rich copper-binding protein CopC
MMKTMVKTFIYSIVVTGLLISSSNGANAHSGLISSNPSQGEVLDQLPQALTLTFNEELIVIDGETVNSLQLIAEGSAEKTELDVNIVGPVINGLLPSGIYPPGLYEIAYRVVSADGHPITGEISFSTQSSTTISSAPPEPVTTAYVDESEESTSQTFIYILAGLLLAFVIAIVMKKRLGNGSRN